MSDRAAREASPRVDLAATSRAATVSAAAVLTLTGLVYDSRAEASEPKRSLGLIVCALALAVSIVWPARFRADRHVLLAGGSFVAVSALSLSWGLPAGARDLETFVAGLGAGVLAALLGPRSARDVARLAALTIGAVSAALAVTSAIRGLPAQELHAGQGNPNWLGLLLAVTLPLSLDAWSTLGGAPLGLRVLTIGASVVQFPALYLSHSRVAWLGAGVACLALLVTARPRRGPRAWALPILLAGSVLTAYAAQSRNDVPIRQAFAGRYWIWENSARAAAESFPLGAGLGRFGHAYLDMQGAALRVLSERQAARQFLNATTAHNDYLQAALESGVISALLLGLTLFLGTRAALRQRWFGGAAALVACSLTALGDSPLRQPAIVLLVGLILGTPGPTAGATPSNRSRVTAGLALALVAFLAADAVRGWLGTHARTRALEGDLDQRAPRLMRAARLDPGAGETQLELGLAQLQRGDAHAALRALTRADTLFADTATRLAIGQAELELGHASRAAQAFERALSWNFGSFRAHLGLAEAYFREQRLEAAEREALVAHRLLPGAERARELLDRIREAQMDR